MKKILIINGHPDKESFNYALSRAYQEGASLTDAQISQLNLAELKFNPNLQYGYRKRTELEPDLRDAIQKIKEADHLVWVFPMWWYSMPALMKGFIDRSFLPGITFENIKGKAFPKKLLKGKSARLIITADTPRWYDRIFMRSPAIRQFKKGTLEFCGIKAVKLTYIAVIKGSTQEFREKCLKKIRSLGENLN
ncbi:MAG: NAD(P)H-dependent oxidoreductase [Bacteroidia bacterium]|nr:NAD(P)H-dependent oxidoreductase [Bacteroidia bacterium]